ncbi:hypothetical protein VFES401_05985 [Aliivibrio fischeri]|uniref:hypothetical protein n=1 Tax=Aliivibrio fischeri TaxID=668 RepID=UPI0009C0C3B6|nr:hypothetical protein [Aliivibrio fischeri]MCE7576186.1 hypothetical protein [Aliivibrio fischeri]MCE7588476.1 hypothetical protein [Aliivibrio fischeri]TGA72026.1 hypothetical protein VFES401_05985 [Aliivibrio fischeri]
MNFSNKDRVAHLYHFDENGEFIHDGSMTIRAHMGLPAHSTEIALPKYNKALERCYFVDGAWVITSLFIGRFYWDEKAQKHCIHSYPQELPESYSLIEPPKANKGFVVQLVDGKWQQIEDHRGQLIFDCSDCTLCEEVKKVGEIKKGFTLSEPSTRFDEWIDNQWVTNQSNKYIDDFNQVDDTRRDLYNRVCDPFFAEARIKRMQGKEQEAMEVEAQALAARKKIQRENPWPSMPKT